MQLIRGNLLYLKELCNLGKFLINAYKLRENLISV